MHFYLSGGKKTLMLSYSILIVSIQITRTLMAIEIIRGRRLTIERIAEQHLIIDERGMIGGENVRWELKSGWVVGRLVGLLGVDLGVEASRVGVDGAEVDVDDLVLEEIRVVRVDLVDAVQRAVGRGRRRPSRCSTAQTDARAHEATVVPDAAATCERRLVA